MSWKRYTPEQIIGLLREAEVRLSQGVSEPTEGIPFRCLVSAQAIFGLVDPEGVTIDYLLGVCDLCISTGGEWKQRHYLQNAFIPHWTPSRRWSPVDVRSIHRHLVHGELRGGSSGRLLHKTVDHLGPHPKAFEYGVLQETTCRRIA